jgi:hypothetical protein
VAELAADTDVAREYRNHHTSSRESTGNDEELLSLAHSSSNSSVLARVEDPNAVVCCQKPYAGPSLLLLAAVLLAQNLQLTYMYMFSSNNFFVQ